jgi:hypothetical protein
MLECIFRASRCADDKMICRPRRNALEDAPARSMLRSGKTGKCELAGDAERQKALYMSRKPIRRT